MVLNAVAPVEEGQEALDAAHARFRNVVEAHAFNHKVRRDDAYDFEK